MLLFFMQRFEDTIEGKPYDLAPKIKENTLRHVHIFEDAADELIHSNEFVRTVRRNNDRDIFDILEVPLTF